MREFWFFVAIGFGCGCLAALYAGLCWLYGVP